MEWTQVFTIIAVNVALMYWMRQDTKDFMNRIETWKDEVNKEMKDFHGRLERQDAEFKGKLALQDAEFKAHLMHYHAEE